MAGYVLSFKNDALTHIENDIWKLKIIFTQHENIRGDQEEDIEIGYADITFVDNRTVDVKEMNFQKGDFIGIECSCLYDYYLKNELTTGVFPTKIITFIEKFYIYPDYRNKNHGKNLFKILIEALSQLPFNEYIVLSPYPVFKEEYGDVALEIGSPSYLELKNRLEKFYLNNCSFDIYRGVEKYDFIRENFTHTADVLDLMVHTVRPKIRNPQFYQELKNLGFHFDIFCGYIADDEYKHGFMF